MKKLPLAAALTVLLLSGCQRQLHPAAPSAALPAPYSPRPALQLQQLWLEGDMHAGTPLPVAVIRADSDRVTFSWNGDAVELLSALARARGQVFSYVGVRLPLPVDIEVQGVTYANVLRIIEMQTTWRAMLMTYPGQMVLQFMSAMPSGPAHQGQGGRR